MPRYLPHALSATLATTAAVLLLSAAPIRAGEQEGAPLVGRLATVEPAARRIAVLPEGEVKLVELLVADDSEVRQGDTEVTLSDLVIQVGRRVTIRYRVEGERRLAESIIVEPEG